MTVNTTTANEIAQAINERLSKITITGGYNTDIGLRVFRGKRALDGGDESSPGDLPCVVMVEGNDSPQANTRTSVQNLQRYILEGHDACDADHPNDKALAIIADIKRCLWGDMERAGMVLGGIAKAIYYKGRQIAAREDGAAIVSAGIQIDVEYVEDLQNP